MTGIVLASASPTRARLLEAAGVEVDVDPGRIDEDAVKDAMAAEGAPARDVGDKLAELKALRTGARHPGRLVLGADQVLVRDGALLSKPADLPAARAQLRRLAGSQHDLLSAAVIVEDGAPVWRHVGQARLRMRPFTDQFLDTYIDRAGADVLGSVGAYRLEELGAQLFAHVQGDYFTILGLPLLEVLGYLRARGVLLE